MILYYSHLDRLSQRITYSQVNNLRTMLLSVRMSIQFLFELILHLAGSDTPFLWLLFCSESSILLEKCQHLEIGDELSSVFSLEGTNPIKRSLPLTSHYLLYSSHLYFYFSSTRHNMNLSTIYSEQVTKSMGKKI